MPDENMLRDDDPAGPASGRNGNDEIRSARRNQGENSLNNSREVYEIENEFENSQTFLNPIH